jgi:hypothetical protein
MARADAHQISGVPIASTSCSVDPAEPHPFGKQMEDKEIGRARTNQPNGFD